MKQRNTARTLSWLAGVLLALIVVIVPSGHFIVSRQYIAGSIDAEAQINARIISQIISENPEMWEFEVGRYVEYLSRRPSDGQSEVRRILNRDNKVVAESADALPVPVIVRSQELFDSGVVVGRIEVARSMRPLIMQTGLIALLMLPLGGGAFLLLRLLPIRAIQRAEKLLWNTNEFLNKVLESTTNAIAVVSKEGKIVHTNRKAAEITGYPPDELVGQPYGMLFAPEAQDAVTEQARLLTRGAHEAVSFRTELIRKDGEVRNIACGAAPLMQDGTVTAVVISAEDITEQTRTEEALVAAKERYRRIVEDLPDLICRYLPDTTITFVNEAYAHYFDRSPDELVGISFLAFICPESREYVRRSVASLSKEIPVVTREHEAVTPDGTVRWQFWRDRAMFDSSGNVTEVQSIGQDITDRKEMEEKLRTMSITDELTGLYNRRGFYAVVEQQLKVAKRLGVGTLILSADLDHLKEINDTMGHKKGDSVLVETARILRECFRESDVIARIGGDEFVVFQMKKNSVDPEMLASRLERKLERCNRQRDGLFRISLSVGIAHFEPESSSTIDDMLDRADSLMYENKRLRQKSS